MSVIRGAGERAHAVHDLLRLRLVIATSVAGVAAALIPVGLAGYGLDVEVTLRLSALLLLLFDYGIIVSFLRAYRPVRGSFPPDRVAVWLVSFLELLQQVSLLAVLLNLTLGSSPALYVTALIANICQAGFIFVRFVGSTFRHAM